VRSRCAGVPEDVIEHLVDAQECLDNDLLRPATVMLGLCYEAAILAVGEKVVADGTLDQAKFTKARRDGLAEVVKMLSDANICQKVGIGGNDRYKVARSLEFAQHLRERRNDGGHTVPTYRFDDRPEVEEFLVSAGRHLPELWRLFTG
jgi:hypothetical protein